MIRGVIPHDMDMSIDHYIELAYEYTQMSSMGILTGKDIAVEYKKSFRGLRGGQSGLGGRYYLSIVPGEFTGEYKYRIYFKYNVNPVAAIIAATEAFGKASVYARMISDKELQTRYSKQESALNEAEKTVLDYMTYTHVYRALREGFSDICDGYTQKMVRLTSVSEEKYNLDITHNAPREDIRKDFIAVLSNTMAVMAASSASRIGVTIPILRGVELKELVVYIRDKVKPYSPTEENLIEIERWISKALVNILR